MSERVPILRTFRSRITPWALATVPYVFLVAWFWNRGPGLEADDYALTLMHAEAIAEGRPYGDTGYLATRLDLSPPRQPPGLPVLVAGTMKLAGGYDPTAVKLLLALVAFPFFLLSGLYFARSHGLATGLGVMLMLVVGVAVTPPQAATHVQSDLGFASLVWGVLYLLDREGRIGWGRVAGVFLLASYAMAYRYLGVALVPAIAVFALVHRREGGARLAAPLAVWGAGGLLAVGAVGWRALAQQLPANAGQLLAMVTTSFWTYVSASVTAHLYPLPGDLPNDAFHLLSLSLALVGLAAWSRSGWRGAAWIFAVCYVAVLLVAANRAGRYLIPLFPILVFGLVHGVDVVAETIARRLERSAPRRLGAAVAGATALAAGTLMLVHEPRTGGWLAELPEAREMFADLAEEGPPERVRVAINQPRVLAWTTGIRAMLLPGDPPEPTLAELERLGITHVVLDRLGLGAGRVEWMLATIAAYPCRFEKTFDNGSFEIYRVLPSCREPALLLEEPSSAP